MRIIYTEAVLGVYELNETDLLIDSDEREKFREIVENELLGLHEGNFARYQIKPPEFRAWQKAWTA